MDCAGLMNIYLHYSNYSPIMLTVHSHDTVASLKEYLPDDGPHRFYHGEFEINPAFTLAYLEIAHEDHIFVTGNEQKHKNAMMQVKRGPVETPRQVNDRLTDQFYNHIEGTSISFRRLINRFCKPSRPNEGKKDSRRHKTKIPKRSENPETDECPMPW